MNLSLIHSYVVHKKDFEIYFIAKKRKFLKVDRGIYFKSCVFKTHWHYQAKLIVQQTTV